jgi:hypothetical protein
MPTLKQLRENDQVNKDLGFNKENDYGKNIPPRLQPIKFTGPVAGTITYDHETQNLKTTSHSEDLKNSAK